MSQIKTKAQTETFSTGVGKILFMAANKPLKNTKADKIEYSIKLELDENDQAVKHLAEVAEYKVDTKTNRALKGTGKVNISFTSTFQPTVVDAEGNKIEGSEIPFFDGRFDKGEAKVIYSVVNYDKSTIVRLTGIKLLSVEINPDKPVSSKGTGTLNSILDKLKTL